MQFCFKMIKGDPCFFYSRSKDLTWKNKQQTSEIENFKKKPNLEKFFNELYDKEEIFKIHGRELLCVPDLFIMGMT